MMFVVTVRCDHVAGWAIRRSTYHFSNEIHLLCGNHVVNARDGVKHSSHLVVMELLFVDFCHGYVEAASNAAIKKHFNNFSSDQVSTPHRSRFIGMARKKRYLL